MSTFPQYITTLEDLPLENLFVPAPLPSKRIMIILHGRGGKSDDFSWIPEYFDFDNLHYLLLNAPKIYGEGYSWFDDSFESIQKSFELLAKTFDILFKEEFDASKSFLFGFSQGALLSFEFGARYSKGLASYIAVSGELYDAQRLADETSSQRKAVPWLCTHGKLDSVIALKDIEVQIEILKKEGFAITFESYCQKAHTIEEDEIRYIYLWIKRIMEVG